MGPQLPMRPILEDAMTGFQRATPFLLDGNRARMTEMAQEAAAIIQTFQIPHGAKPVIFNGFEPAQGAVDDRKLQSVRTRRVGDLCPASRSLEEESRLTAGVKRCPKCSERRSSARAGARDRPLACKDDAGDLLVSADLPCSSWCRSMCCITRSCTARIERGSRWKANRSAALAAVSLVSGPQTAS